jgi:hypothetical protein
VLAPSTGCVSGISTFLGWPQAVHQTGNITRFLDTASGGCFFGNNVFMRDPQTVQAHTMRTATCAFYSNPQRSAHVWQSGARMSSWVSILTGLSGHFMGPCSHARWTQAQTPLGVTLGFGSSVIRGFPGIGGKRAPRTRVPLLKGRLREDSEKRGTSGKQAPSLAEFASRDSPMRPR